MDNRRQFVSILKSKLHPNRPQSTRISIPLEPEIYKYDREAKYVTRKEAVEIVNGRASRRLIPIIQWRLLC